MSPKAFISYSWSSPGHRARILKWAEQLVSDGVDVVIDTWDLNEGDDKYHFMERMVTDDSVTHVLMFCDSQYAAKADERKSGVGTESQIISKEIYKQVKQNKFIPIVCEMDDDGEPYLPAFLNSRIGIDFSTSEAVNENWERLVRALYGKPAEQKPALGKPPAYVREDSSVPPSPASRKFATFRQALIQEKPARKAYRRDFLNACYDYADALRIKKSPDEKELEEWGERVLSDCGKLKVVRDQLVDWVLLESEINSSEEFSEALIEMLERLLELKSRPSEITAWSDTWFEAHAVFVYETFLYIIAALMKTGAYNTLHLVLTSHYLLPDPSGCRASPFDTFDAFHGSSGALQILASEGHTLHSPAATLIKRQADRTELPFADIKQAELLVLMMSFVNPECRWYPGTLHYASHAETFPFFVRAAQHRNFLKLAKVTGISDADTLRKAVLDGKERVGIERWHSFWFADRTFLSSMNMDALDTLK